MVVGGVLYGNIFRRALAEGGDAIGIAVMILIPGLLITLATQVMWARYRLENRPGADIPPATPIVLPEDSLPPARPSRPRRRGPRRLRARSGRPPK